MEQSELEQLKKKYTVSDEKLKEISDLIFNKMVYGKTPQKNPIMVICGGQPGAGKSGLIDKTQAEMPNSVVLDVDDFRYFHPDIKEILKNYPNDLATFTISFVNKMFNNVVKKLQDEKYNLIAQKTLKDDEVIYDTLEPLKKAGYTIVVRVLAVSELESKMSALERSLAVKNTVGYCRWTPINNQNYAYSGMVPTAKHIFESDSCDVIQIFKRNDIPTNSDVVYSKSKPESKKIIDASLKNCPTLNLNDCGQNVFEDEVEAILKTRDKDTFSKLGEYSTRILLAKRTMDEEGLKYLEQLEELTTDYYLKLNDLHNGYMNNNIKLELAKEVMARKVADCCRDGFNPNDSQTKLILDEEKEMNKFNTFVIDKIINQYGSEIKSGEKV